MLMRTLYAALKLKCVAAMDVTETIQDGVWVNRRIRVAEQYVSVNGLKVHGAASSVLNFPWQRAMLAKRV
jgi:hypothetical protein